MRVLIVDDSASDRKLIERSLAFEHHSPEIESASRRYRETDDVACHPRGGEILAIVKLPDTSREGAGNVAGRIIRAFSDRTILAGDRALTLSPRGRLAGYPQDGSTAAELLRAIGLAPAS